MRIDVTKTPQENILALALDANPGVQMTLSQFTIGVPAAAEDGATRNSTVELVALPNLGFRGARVIRYNRLPLTAGVPNAAVPTEVQVLAEDNQASAGAKVIAALGLVASEVVVGDFVAPVNEDTPGSITLTPVVDSLLYVGDAVIMPLTVADTDVAMEDVLVNDEMNGFDAA